MKLKCPSCGKKEKEMMSKYQIASNSFVNPMVLATVLALVVGTQRIWPARAFTLGHLTHNDLASVRIAKRATKSL